MADVLSQVNRHTQYPWNQWCDGRAYAATQGRDFQCSPASFRSAIYMRALRMGAKAKVAIHGNKVEFQFLLKSAPKKAVRDADHRIKRGDT